MCLPFKVKAVKYKILIEKIKNIILQFDNQNKTCTDFKWKALIKKI